MTYFISRLLYKALLKILFGFKVIGKENIPKKGPFIMASNHVSIADPAVVGVACHTAQLTFMAKKELFDIPVFGLWFRAVGCIPTERDFRNFGPVKKAVKRLKAGGVLGIFPEGTRSVDGQLKKLEPGIGLIALKSGAPIVPVYISGTQKALPKGKKFLRPCKVTAKIGKIVDISESTGLSEKRKIYESIGEKVMDAILSLKDE